MYISSIFRCIFAKPCAAIISSIFRIICEVTQRFTQPEVTLPPNLQNHEERVKECSCEWLVNTDPGRRIDLRQKKNL